MTKVNYLNLVYKAKRHDRQQRRKDPSLAALVAGCGEVRFVCLWRVDGSTVVYGVTIESAKISFHRDDRHEKKVRAKGNGNGHGAPAAVSEAERAKQALELVFDIIANAEGRVSALLHPESEPPLAAE